MYYSLVDIYSSGKFSKTPAASGPNLLEALRTDLLQVGKANTRMNHIPLNDQY